MSSSVRNRLLGIAAFLAGIAGLWFMSAFSETTAVLVSFLAGACLGAGSALVVTGRFLWTSEQWWATRHPLKRDWF